MHSTRTMLRMTWDAADHEVAESLRWAKASARVEGCRCADALETLLDDLEDRVRTPSEVRAFCMALVLRGVR